MTYIITGWAFSQRHLRFVSGSLADAVRIAEAEFDSDYLIYEGSLVFDSEDVNV